MRLHMIARLALLVACGAGCVPTTMGRPASSTAQTLADHHEADFEVMWKFVHDRFCCFHERTTDWNAVRTRYLPLAVASRDDDAWIAVLEAALNELYDAHTHLGVNLPSSWRLPPYDVWAERRGGRFIVSELLADSPASSAGMHAGDEIVSADSTPIAQAIAMLRPQCLRAPSPAADEWALLSLLAGRHDRSRRFTLRRGDGTVREVLLENADLKRSSPIVEDRTVSGGLAYIRIASFASSDAVRSFDDALARHRDARGLLLDVRNNDGGDTAIARPIMGRFVDDKRQYAWMSRRSSSGNGLSDRWPEYVKPRGPFTYRSPIVVLVNHWSQSMAEGFAMGLDGMRRATSIGTRMAGLGAGIARTTLPHSRVTVQISAEPIYHVDGTPRSLFRPTVEVDLATSRGGDPIFDAGVAALTQALSRNEQASKGDGL